MFITETWLKPEVTDPEIFPMNSSYSVIARKDRTSGEHGCVLIATKNSFALNYTNLSYDADYCIGLSIYSGAVNHIFLLIYNPSASSQFRIPAKMLTDSIRYFNSKLINGSSSYTILGDLNLPDICWASSDGGCDYSKLFLEDIEDHSLLPLIYEPTHRSGNTIDIIITSHTELFTAFVNEVFYSDHFPLFAFLPFLKQRLL